MNRPNPILIGFFPKKVVPRTDWFKNPVVRDICSVSTCISPGPDNWINKWKHNTDTWLFDTPAAARSILAPEDYDFTVFAFRAFPVLFDGESTHPWDITPAPPYDLSSFAFIGYDIVSRYGGTNFSCSPLSCNNGCETIPVNEHCLIDNLDDAWEAAERIGAESHSKQLWEPGPYCLIEVNREQRRGEQGVPDYRRQSAPQSDP